MPVFITLLRQVFGEAVIGKAGLVVISLLVALTTFGGGHSNVFTAARYIYIGIQLPRLV